MGFGTTGDWSARTWRRHRPPLFHVILRRKGAALSKLRLKSAQLCAVELDGPRELALTNF
jgi:hypothetical protein